MAKKILQFICITVFMTGMIRLFPYAGSEIRHYKIQKEIAALEESTQIENWKEPAGCRDLAGILSYDSLDMKEEIVQGSDNRYYLDHLCDGTPSEQGTLFFDADTEKEDQNRVLYGHHVFYARSRMTPLFDLLKTDVNENDLLFTLSDQDTVTVYRMIAVIEEDFSDPKEYSFLKRNYENEEWDEYNQQLRRHCISVFYEEVKENDRLLTMVTCRDEDSPVRILFIAKECGTKRKDIPQDI